MTPEQLQEAVQYNRRHGYSPEQIKLVQSVVSASPVDGKWGPNTVYAVVSWQSASGLKPDGKVGPRTYQAIVEADECTPGGLIPTVPDNVEVGCGLAAYDQRFPGHAPTDALKAAWNAAIQDGCKEIRYWSSEWLIRDIGHKGNSYSEPFLQWLDVPDDVTVGAWIDDPIGAVKRPEYVARLRGMHISAAALMMNHANTMRHHAPWSLRWDDDDLKAVADVFDLAGIEVICTTWPRPSKNQIDAMCEDMNRLLPLCNAVAFEVDTEANWTRRFLDGFSSMEDAAEYLAMQMRAASDGRRLELTTYTYHQENSKRASLAPKMDRLLPQAYSVRHRDSGLVSYIDALGPGRHQRLALGRARLAASA